MTYTPDQCIWFPHFIFPDASVVIPVSRPSHATSPSKSRKLNRRKTSDDDDEENIEGNYDSSADDDDVLLAGPQINDEIL